MADKTNADTSEARTADKSASSLEGMLKKYLEFRDANSDGTLQEEETLALLEDAKRLGEQSGMSHVESEIAYRSDLARTMCQHEAGRQELQSLLDNSVKDINQILDNPTNTDNSMKEINRIIEGRYEPQPQRSAIIGMVNAQIAGFLEAAREAVPNGVEAMNVETFCNSTLLSPDTASHPDNSVSDRGPAASKG